MAAKLTKSGESSLAVHEDHSSPYFLSPSDNPGVQLVTQQLTGSNYNSWYHSMTTALMAKNKLDFVNGALSRPKSSDPLYSQWIRCNSMVISWLRNSVTPEISSSIMYLEDGNLIWEDLKDRFSQEDLARIYQLRQQLVGLRQGNDDIGTYYTKLRVLWDEYRDFQPTAWCTCDTCKCGSAKRWCIFQSQECVLQFLMGLHPSYSQLRSHILSITHLIPLQKVFALVLQEERQRSIESVFPSQSSLGENSGSVINAASGGRGRGGRGKFLCTKCGKTNHTIDKCFEIIGYPPGYGRGRCRGNGGPRAVNQVSAGADAPSYDNSGMKSSDAGALTPAQLNQMFQYLQTQMQNQTHAAVGSSMHHNAQETSTSGSSVVSSPFSGSFSGNCDWEG